ncbi:MAG: PIG-L family deacetylase [Acidobacteriaceae bacterium]|nr:PIG-L family deacetylase [Acidobacteriaceae bacterium]
MRKAFSDLCYYVVAHQDDWQLFYGHQAFLDLTEPGARVVLVYTTAGDAGRTDGWWQAREQGALAAQSLSREVPQPRTIHIGRHPIAIYDAGAFISYHLRLPDGNIDGTGFDSTGRASLQKLQAGGIAEIAAIDGSTSYAGWNDFCATLGAILDREGLPGTAWINAADWSWSCSPRDHWDHKATADALRQLAGAKCNRLWFTTYSNDARPANLNSNDLAHKEAVWLAYRQHVQALADVEFLDWEWETWGAKNYFRRVLAGQDDTSGS